MNEGHGWILVPSLGPANKYWDSSPPSSSEEAKMIVKYLREAYEEKNGQDIEMGDD